MRVLLVGARSLRALVLLVLASSHRGPIVPYAKAPPRTCCVTGAPVCLSPVCWVGPDGL